MTDAELKINKEFTRKATVVLLEKFAESCGQSESIEVPFSSGSN